MLRNEAGFSWLTGSIMHGTTITTIIWNTVTLGTDGYDSPLTITDTGGVEPTIPGICAGAAVGGPACFSIAAY